MNVAGRILGVWVLAGAALVAADFWDEKDFTTWSDEEVEKMLTDSPWAKRVRVSIGGPGSGGGFSPFSREENYQRASAVRDGRARAGDDNIRGRGRGDGFAEGSPRVVLTVSWRSALPIKQALVRAQAGIGAAVPPEQRPFLIQQEPLYLVTISGIPRPFGEGLNREAVLERTTLEREDADPIAAEDVEPYLVDGETFILEFAFLRDDPITLLDRNVEFVTELGEVEIKRSFNVQEMMFGDALAM